MTPTILTFVICSLFVFASVQSQSTVPEQIHLALSDQLDEVTIVWATEEDTNTTTVLYGLTPTNLSFSATGSSSQLLLSPYIHVTQLKSLEAGTTYYYQVGDQAGGWSDTFNFKTPHPDIQSVIFFVFGDHGTGPNSDMVFNAMLDFDNKYRADFLIHVGDLSYADGIESRWDTWLNNIEPLASHLPWMVAAGNHELFDAFLTYNSRFRMPANGDNNMYYSFNYGPIHHITLNSETVSYSHLLAQYKWLVKDLSQIDRTATPWVFASWHTPWYCSNKAHENAGNRMRESYEPLFNQYKVDLVFTGHVHAYERTYGVFNNQVSSDFTVYTTVGTGGNHEGLYSQWEDPQPEWSAARYAEYGFATVYIYNSTTLDWNFIRAKDNTIIDSFTLYRDR